MFFKQKKFNQIPDKLFSTASACSLDLANLIEPKNGKLIVFEIIVYIVSRIDSAMVRNHLHDAQRTELLKAIWLRVGDYCYDLSEDIEIHEALNDRMDQYGGIYRESSGTEIWKRLHEMLKQLLFHAAQNERLFKWRMGSDPILLADIREEIALQTLLSDLEIRKIIPFEADCNKIFNAMSTKGE